ncbi:MAG: quinone-dependent dihydroorotate dehydrogenase [Candidatus Vogelbacteria bacterium]|nr:quinone-dependent dihydroorotate dehydrogenase [Candidatus Vogelbacteria bacterium]
MAKTWFDYQNPILEQEILGIKFKNPIGLAAGFDKNAEMIDIMSAVGFGFTEVGSVTGRACAGNPKPRLWRLPKSRSLIVYYGLKNNGAEEIAKRLKANEVGSGYTRSNLVRPKFPVGISLAKTNDEKTITTEDGIADYLLAYQKFVEAGVSDYYTINISCPNAFGGEPFVDPIKLDRLLSALNSSHGTLPKSDLATRDTTSSALPWPKPVFLKMPPDLNHEQVDQIIDLARKYKINGFICSNLTKDRSNEFIKNKIKEKLPTDVGGLSGKIVEDLANEQIKYIYQKIHPVQSEALDNKMIIIGCGGVFLAKDAYAKIKAGASLIQLITGMIFEGPQLIGQINQGLVELLQKDGYKNIGEAIGKGF